MSNTPHKKLSSVLSNTDQNTYRAFKMALDNTKSRTERNTNLNSPVNMKKKEYNMSKNPFGLTEKRFKWQDEHPNNMGFKLQGNLKTYNYTKRETHWDVFVNENENCFSNMTKRGSIR